MISLIGHYFCGNFLFLVFNVMSDEKKKMQFYLHYSLDSHLTETCSSDLHRFPQDNPP